MFFHHDQVVTNQDLTGDRRQFADETAQDIIAVADAAQRPRAVTRPFGEYGTARARVMACQVL